MALRKRQQRRTKQKPSQPLLRVESLEPKMMLTGATLDVVSVGGGPDFDLLTGFFRTWVNKIIVRFVSLDKIQFDVQRTLEDRVLELHTVGCIL